MTEFLKDNDFNVSVPYAWKKRKMKEANKAIDMSLRIEQQIIHWEGLPDDNIFSHGKLPISASSFSSTRIS